jgi:hypothetical protein
MYLVEACAALLTQPSCLHHCSNQVPGVGAGREGVHKVLAHMQPNVGPHQVVQPAMQEQYGISGGRSEASLMGII